MRTNLLQLVLVIVREDERREMILSVERGFSSHNVIGVEPISQYSQV